MKFWTESDSMSALGPDLPQPRQLLTDDLAIALSFASEVGPDVVAKSSGVPHKTEHGLVRVGIDVDELEEAFAVLAAGGDGRVLVSEMVHDAEYEIIVGGMRDEVFGPVVAVGLGGVAAEVFRDITFLLSPPPSDEMNRALANLNSAGLLDGVRGRSPLDRAALHRIVTAVGELLERVPTVLEVDCNPVMVVHGKPIVVDALVTEADEEQP